jgi:hypothetical protein
MRCWVLAAAVALGLPAPALAQESASHVYACAMFGQSHWRSPCSGQTSCDDTDRALRVFGGYPINRIFSAEAGFNNLGKATGNTASIKG